jgi:hypothetical protein
VNEILCLQRAGWIETVIHPINHCVPLSGSSVYPAASSLFSNQLYVKYWPSGNSSQFHGCHVSWVKVKCGLIIYSSLFLFFVAGAGIYFIPSEKGAFLCFWFVETVGTLHTAISGGMFCMYTRLLCISLDEVELGLCMVTYQSVTFISYRIHFVKKLMICVCVSLIDVNSWCVDVLW